jgi:hypothetical protein
MKKSLRYNVTISASLLMTFFQIRLSATYIE